MEFKIIKMVEMIADSISMSYQRYRESAAQAMQLQRGKNLNLSQSAKFSLLFQSCHPRRVLCDLFRMI